MYFWKKQDFKKAVKQMSIQNLHVVYKLNLFDAEMSALSIEILIKKLSLYPERELHHIM